MKQMVIMILLAMLTASTAAAVDKPQGGFWDNLKSKVEKVTPRKKTGGGTAIGGVRSAPQQESELYWKGKDHYQDADEDELGLFKQGINKAIGGERNESIRLFEAFLGSYPDSRLKDDCLKALTELKKGN